jgi:hypothetical protein
MKKTNRIDAVLYPNRGEATLVAIEVFDTESPNQSRILFSNGSEVIAEKVGNNRWKIKGAELVA